MADPIVIQATPTLLSRSEFRLKPRPSWCRDYLAKSKSYVVLGGLQGIILSPLVRIVQAHTHVSSDRHETRAKRARPDN